MPTPAFSQDVGQHIEAKNGLPKLIKSIVTEEKGKQTLIHPHYPGSLEDKARRAQYHHNYLLEVGIQSNQDRFGKMVLPRKPFNDVPGPGGYESINLDRVRQKTSRNVVMHSIPEAPESVVNTRLGPTTYPNVPPAFQVSHHYWAGESQKPWVN